MAGSIRSYDDAEDVLRGFTLLGTGGGGYPTLGREILRSRLDKDGEIRFVDPAEIPDDAWTVSTFSMGSIAPKSGGNSNSPLLQELKEKKVPRPMVKAVQMLQEYTGIKIGAIVAFEIGAHNTSGPLDAAAALGIPAVDGDYAGRAVPEASQCMTAVSEHSFCPAAIADSWGNGLIMKEAVSATVAESIGKMISLVTKHPDPLAVCGFAAYLIPGAQMKKIVVPGTVSRSLQLGRLIRKSRENGEDPAWAVARAMEGWVVFRGKVSERRWESTEGYMWGTNVIDGAGKHAGKRLEIWFKNEHHLARIQGGPILAMSPDIIAIVRAADGEPITNSYLQEGEQVSVIAAPHKVYRTPQGLAALGPSHFGFDFPYQPVEDLIKKQEGAE